MVRDAQPLVKKDRPLTVVLLTALTLGAFAANSLLCRMALGGDLIDPVSFSTIQASVLQPSVPVLATFGGVVFLSEEVSLRLAAASALILGGVALAVVKRGAVKRSE